MAQLENIGALEKRLWSSADLLRSSSNFSSNEYFLPVMGLIFLRHAYSRYLAVKPEIEANLPSRGGKPRALTPEDFSGKGAIYLPDHAQFDYLVDLTEADDRAEAIIKAMEAIEGDYKTLEGVLPKREYQELDNDVLGTLLRTFNDPALKKATGDVFGRIYEYFLTQFADQKAHDGGEFFTPASIVQMIVNVIEPNHGNILDPACGSGGMFVQSAHFIEQMKKNPQDVATFYGMEKNPTTIRLAKMNLAVHGLEGNIAKAITYYEDPFKLVDKCDFVMANPPFNVDEVDAEKVKQDPRLPFGLPGVNKKKKVSNGNYLWISYFYAYLKRAIECLKDEGRAGFVMSSQASSAAGDEAKVRQKLIESGHVDAMIAIRGNFFYTRPVPCELWFLNKKKPEAHTGKVLMVDARNVFTKVTRKIYHFSPEQLHNLTSIFWLYRGQHERFKELVEAYISSSLNAANDCLLLEAEGEVPASPLPSFKSTIEELAGLLKPFLDGLGNEGEHAELCSEVNQTKEDFTNQFATFEGGKNDCWKYWNKHPYGNAKALFGFCDEVLSGFSVQSKELRSVIDHLFKMYVRLVEFCETNLEAKSSKHWDTKKIRSAIKEADALRYVAIDQLKQIQYFYKHAHWLQVRFPDGELRDVDGLVKLADHDELAANDWSLTPGRYVGVAPEEEDEDFDFEEALRDIHLELAGLNEEAETLAAQIQKNFEELGG